MDVLKIFIVAIITELIVIMFKKIKGYNKYCNELWVTPQKTHEERGIFGKSDISMEIPDFHNGCFNTMGFIGHKPQPNMTMGNKLQVIGTRPGYTLKNQIKCNGM